MGARSKIWFSDTSRSSAVIRRLQAQTSGHTSICQHDCSPLPRVLSRWAMLVGCALPEAFVYMG